ncbi:MAG: hypothetical protein ABF723_03075 [Lentilactobacillus hilgardii]|uniref:hypothetical protein n=1 Tax=Lentilactobacillus hilgardii TaxID=1588 RepID=UPI001CC20078|nr:hypothetical protein [Lentilactobacillus hilgardii]MBZ2201536.1 hypothetical protein [Lentilactobacillus hilgardii]MBZ2204454.1 hypothetical protein [Lentilactobacillus hilgardii]
MPEENYQSTHKEINVHLESIRVNKAFLTTIEEMKGYLKGKSYFNADNLRFDAGQTSMTINFTPDNLNKDEALVLFTEARVLYNTNEHSGFVVAKSKMTFLGAIKWNENDVQNFLNQRAIEIMTPVLKKITFLMYALFDSSEIIGMVPDLLELAAKRAEGSHSED